MPSDMNFCPHAISRSFVRKIFPFLKLFFFWNLNWKFKRDSIAMWTSQPKVMRLVMSGQKGSRQKVWKKCGLHQHTKLSVSTKTTVFIDENTLYYHIDLHISNSINRLILCRCTLYQNNQNVYSQGKSKIVHKPKT